MKRILIALVGVLAATFSFAEIRFKNIYQDNMVLQANEPNIIAGRSDANSGVELILNAKAKNGKNVQKSFKTKADKNGMWAVKIPAFPKRTDLELTAKNDSGESAKITNVVTGELWLGSGQSNMEWYFDRPTIEKEFLERHQKIADELKGDVRVFITASMHFTKPLNEVGGRVGWRIVDGKNLKTSGSQICIIFAGQLAKALDTPVGIIDSSWGGSRIESWIPKSAFVENNLVFGWEGKNYTWADYEKEINNYAKIRDQYINEFAEWFEKYPSRELQGKNSKTCPKKPIDEFSIDQLPGKRYNAKIHGIAPLAPKGVLWYQGESNAGEPFLYGEQLKALVTSWRKLFKRDFYFYYVDLAALNDTQKEPVQYYSWGGIREAMTEVLELPKTGVATSIDSGGSKMQGQGDIHPPHKEFISTRLANLALAEVYKKGNPVHARSPRYSGEFKVEGNKLTVKITNADGLRKMDRAEKLTGFAIRGENPRDWKWADAEIKDDTIVLSSPEVAEPKAARYAWASWPLVSVESSHGLPLLSFSTDNGAYVDWNKQPRAKK